MNLEQPRKENSYLKPSFKKIPLIFFGHDRLSRLVLFTLLDNPSVLIAAVISLPDKPQGRQKRIIPNPIKIICRQKKIPYFLLDDFTALKNRLAPFPRIGLLASFGAKIPLEIINSFSKGILVIHPSILPFYRGISPVPSAILEGEKKTGVTVFKMDEKWDHGPIISQRQTPIKPTDTSRILLEKLFLLGAEIFIEALPGYLSGETKPQKQNHLRATYTRRFGRKDGEINWNIPPEKIDRQIRAFNPWPESYTFVKLKTKKRLKILKAHLEKGKLVLDLVQLEGKKAVSWKQFLTGHPNAEIVQCPSTLNR
ncbi:MAG: methionyl-tRNA formyltransferase [Candidatus Pacebacteria bacterium]|nr:methionyl-tRNA formyltransferase [Candidatus Paceibacterota bacterium]